MQAYRWTAERVLRELNSAPGGLSRKQAAARLAKHGENRLARKKGDSLWRRFMLQLSDPMILVLLAAAAVSAVLCVVHREFPADVLIIMTVVTVNAVLGVVQESKAEKAIAALQEMTPATSRVLRGGAECTVPSRTLVPGDVVLLSAGDRIPADCRVLESIGLRVEESALTGESQPVEKSAAPLPDDGQALPPSACSNLVFMGANVVYGRGRAVVIATGMDTQMGRIAHALNTAGQNATPLQKKLTQLSKILSLLVLAICAGIFALDVGRSLLAGGLTFSGALSTFMVAVSLAVAAIPEGLAAVVTIVLSIGVTKMSRRHAVIRRLTAVETLGCTQVICSDKTGTLTQNKMTVTARTGVPPEQLMTAMALCSDAHRAGDRMEGEPTEVALVQDAADLGLEKAALERQYPRVGELPFDSARKMMTTLHRTSEGVVQYTKGAPDVVLKRCTHTWQQGRVVSLDCGSAPPDPGRKSAYGRPGAAGALRCNQAVPVPAVCPVAGGTGAGALLPGAGGYDGSGAPGGGGGHCRLSPSGHSSGDDHRRSSGYCRGHCPAAGDLGAGGGGAHRRPAGAKWTIGRWTMPLPGAACLPVCSRSIRCAL